MSLKFKKFFKEAITPKAGNLFSAGIDLFIPTNVAESINPGYMTKIDTGIGFEMPEGYVGLIRPRGSALAKGLIINGTIDQDFRGQISLFITNASGGLRHIEAGKSYAQMILIKQDSSLYHEVEEVTELSTTERGTGMLGSTGNS